MKIRNLLCGKQGNEKEKERGKRGKMSENNPFSMGTLFIAMAASSVLTAIAAVAVKIGNIPLTTEVNIIFFALMIGPYAIGLIVASIYWLRNR